MRSDFVVEPPLGFDDDFRFLHVIESCLQISRIDEPCDCSTSASRSIVMMCSGVNLLSRVTAVSLEYVQPSTQLVDKFVGGAGGYAHRRAARPKAAAARSASR